jgi:hypothetical protein
MTPSSAASPSKVSPLLTPLPPPTCSRSPPLPSSQSPHRSCALYHAPTTVKWAPGPAPPPHKTRQTVKWTHLTPDMSQLEASPPFTFRNRFDELSHLSDDDMHRSDNDLSATAGTPSAQQPREHKPPPIHVYGVTNYQDMVSYLRPLLRRSNTTAKLSRTKRSKSTFTPLILTVG